MAHKLKPFNINDTAFVLIDHQVGTTGWVHSADPKEIERNAILLAKFAAAANIPIVLTSSMEDNVQGTGCCLIAAV